MIFNEKEIDEYGGWQTAAGSICFWILSLKLNPQLIMREWYYMDEKAGIEKWNNSKYRWAQVFSLTHADSTTLALADRNHPRNDFHDRR